jgi:hypothetical protein
LNGRPGAPGSVVEADSAKAAPQIERQATEDYAHVLLGDVVDAVSARLRQSEFDAR